MWKVGFNLSFKGLMRVEKNLSISCEFRLDKQCELNSYYIWNVYFKCLLLCQL